MMLALSQTQTQTQTRSAEFAELNSDSLKMDEFMLMKMRHDASESPECTSQCVSRCGQLAELPMTDAVQLLACFRNTCGCADKAASAGGVLDETTARQFFDLIHSQERVEYLLLQ